jgi:hypothetical protein
MNLSGLIGKEGVILRKTILPMLYYCALMGAVAFIWINGVGLNAGTVALAVVLAVLAGTATWLYRDGGKTEQTPHPSATDPRESALRQ